ncbi:MAG: hypothetical protein H6684_15965 [Deltaproteobacteria bacterium]|nr:hypothetical protein [bacterium]MCB9475628.1 hypothetical protein [Deltaproteobacteria bacterium]MCB9490227.1 hypothetical protein [Deltaproteobacteria bacterium]
MRNCDGRSNPAFRVVVGDEVLDRCPAAVITPLSWALLKRWQRRRLPSAVDNSNPISELVVQAMECVESVWTRYEQEDLERLERSLTAPKRQGGPSWP